MTKNNFLREIQNLIPSIEVGSIIILTVLQNLILLKYLGLVQYGEYGYLIALTILVGAGNLGIGQLIPKWSLEKNCSGKVYGSVLVQFLTTGLIGSLILTVITLNEGNKYSILQLVCILIYVISQQIDEIIHIYLRLDSKEINSAIINILGKFAIIIIIIFNKDSSGKEIFEIVAATMFFITIIKNIIYKSISDCKFTNLEYIIKEIIYESKSIWLSNISNSIFNGIGRIMISDIYGVKILGLFTIISQITGAIQMVLNSLILLKIKNLYNNSLNIKNKNLLYINLKLITIKLFFLVFVSNIMLCIWKIIYQNEVNVLTLEPYEKLLLVISIPIITTLPIAVVPEYLNSQFRGGIKKIAQLNFSLAACGIFIMYMMMLNQTLVGLSILIMAIITISSVVYTRNLDENF